MLTGLDKKKAFKVRRHAVFEMAKYLGMDLEIDSNLLFLADEALFAPVEGAQSWWVFKAFLFVVDLGHTFLGAFVCCVETFYAAPWVEKKDPRGFDVYWNPETKILTTEHPMDSRFKEMYKSMGKVRPLEEREALKQREREAQEQRRLQKERLMARIPKPLSTMTKISRVLGFGMLWLILGAGCVFMLYNLYQMVTMFDSGGPWFMQIMAMVGSVDAQVRQPCPYSS